MENVSKALIIAGAVLITILLISLGTSFFSSISTFTKEKQDIDETSQDRVFNAKITKYEGKKLSYNQVAECLEFLISYTKDNEYPIGIYFNNRGEGTHNMIGDFEYANSKTASGRQKNANEIIKFKNSLDKTQTYRIECNYFNSDYKGRISSITIMEEPHYYLRNDLLE